MRPVSVKSVTLMRNFVVITLLLTLVTESRAWLPGIFPKPAVKYYKFGNETPYRMSIECMSPFNYQGVTQPGETEETFAPGNFPNTECYVYIGRNQETRVTIRFVRTDCADEKQKKCEWRILMTHAYHYDHNIGQWVRYDYQM